MKKIKYYSLAVTLIFLFSSCNKLNLAPEDFYGSNNFWANQAQVQGFIYGLHQQLRSASVNLWLMGEARGGDPEIRHRCINYKCQHELCKSVY